MLSNKGTQFRSHSYSSVVMPDIGMKIQQYNESISAICISFSQRCRGAQNAERTRVGDGVVSSTSYDPDD